MSTSRSDARQLVLAAGLVLACAATAGEVRVTVVSGLGEPLAGAVASAVALDGAPPPPPQPEGARTAMDQIDKEFVPHVLAIPAGTEVDFPNHDDVQHHVYSFSPAKQFELPLYRGTPTRPVRFDTPGVVTLGCNIHDWMIGYIYVSGTPWFATTGDDGSARLALPPGRWRVRVWHPRMRTAEDATARDVTVGADTADEQSWRLDLKPDLLGRRAPVGSRRDY